MYLDRAFAQRIGSAEVLSQKVKSRIAPTRST